MTYTTFTVQPSSLADLPPRFPYPLRWRPRAFGTALARARPGVMS